MAPSYKTKLAGLKDGSLVPSDFTHLDHIGVAYEAISQLEFFEALLIVAKGLRDLATRADAPEKFNATITFAYMSLIAERMKTGHYSDAQDFIRNNRDLTEKSLLGSRYSRARLFSVAARSIPLLPETLAQPGPAAR